MPTLTEKIKKIGKEVESLKKDFAKFVKDKSLPLDERWGLFVEYGRIYGGEGSWVQHFKVEQKLKHKEICWYDDFYVERRQTVELPQIIESIEENLCEDSDWTEELVVEFKEEILDKNMYSFTYDW